MNKLAELPTATSMSLSLDFVGTGEALTYSFTPITVSESSNPWFRELGAPPSLNDRGTIAFWVYYQDSSKALYTASNGSRNLLSDNTSSGAKFFLVAGEPIINNRGTVAVYGELDRGGEAILTFNRESFTTIADSKTSFFCFPSSVAINNNGTVVFAAELDTGNRGIFKSNGGYTKQIAELPAKDALSIYDPMITRVAINNSGTVAFTYWEFVDFLPGYSALYINDAIGPIADNIGKFARFTNLAINDEGKLVFSADLASGNQGIFLYDGKEIIEIANNNDSSYFQDFSLSNPAINNQGTVAFFAEQNFSGDNYYQGIFTGSNPETDKVIAVGDDLLGSKVKKLEFSSKGLNNLGQIAFYAELENGTKGFFLANPRLKSVSEPVSVFSMLAMVADGLTMKRSQENII